MEHLHSDLRLYISSQAYHLVHSSQTLSIQRKTNEISLINGPLPSGTGYERSLPVYGLFGIISLINSDYLIFITSRRRITRINQTDIYQATDFAVFPIDPSPKGPAALLEERGPEEAYLLSLVKAHLFSAPFYFAYGGSYDLTTRLQAQRASDANKPLWERADERFFWNKFLHTRLIEMTSRGQADFSKFILPVMFGFLESRHTSINGNPFTFCLISRRSRHRAGTRYFSRGLDVKGNVSNFNESEMLVFVERSPQSLSASYVQIRGSVPVYWGEVNNLRYKPDLKIMEKSNTLESAQRHFDSLVEQYGDIYAVNTVNQKGYERAVKDAFEKTLEQLKDPKVHYTYFDFHHECKGMHFERVSVLINGLAQDLAKQAFFYHDAANSEGPQFTQQSVVRTNCMDCLDRTNVVQSAFASHALSQILRQAGILKEREVIENHSDFMYIFRNIWADNANTVSKAYSGSGALKTDYTRTGVRTKKGALQDGYNSLLRYVKNNFLDGPRQDAYDLMNGAWDTHKRHESPLDDRRPLPVQAAPYALAVFSALLFLSIWQPYLFGRRFKVFLLSAVTALFYFIVSHGVDYVTWPRLNRIDDVIYYTGKGHSSGRHGYGRLGQTYADPVTGHGSKETLQGVGARLDNGQRVTSSRQQQEWRRQSTAVELGHKRQD